MQKLLLTVEQAFTATNRGVIVTPEISIDQASKLPSLVTLKHPDGKTVRTEATFPISHIQTRSTEHSLKIAKNLRYTCLLNGIDKVAVPVGTEIWIDNTER